MSHIDDGKALLEENAKLRKELAEAKLNLEVADVDWSVLAADFRSMKQRAEAAEAKLKVLSEQEPAMNITDGVITWSQVPKGFSGVVFYEPAPPVWSEQEPCICLTNIFDNDPETGEKKHCHDCGGTGTIQREDAQFWVDRCLALEAERAELERKLAEQQALIAKLCDMTAPHNYIPNSFEELNTILAKARDEGRKERAELAAQVEVIRKALAELKSEAWSVPVQQLMYRGNFVVRRANDALSITPSAALREIQARALEEAAECIKSTCVETYSVLLAEYVDAADWCVELAAAKRKGEPT